MEQLEREAIPVQSVDRAMTKGALWMILAKFGDRGLGLISTIILVRVLTPADFGLVAMGTSVIAICELLGRLGLDVALIQNPDVTRRHYDTAWTISVILSAATAVAIVFLAAPAATFYGEPRLLPIFLSLALGSFISGFENIGTVAFQKELRFKKEFQFFFGKKLAAFLVTVPLALILQSYWALIAGIVVGRLVGVALSYYLQDYRPRWSLAVWRELFHFSKWLVIHSVCYTLNNRAADFIVGKFGGARDLGVFNVSYEISNLPTSELVAPINRAVFPAYALKSKDSSLLRQGYLAVLGMIAACGIPAGVGIAVTSYWLVPLVLGDKWMAAIPLVSMLALYGVLSVVRSNAHYVFLAQGKPHLATYLAITQLILLIPSLIVLTMYYGVVGAAYAYMFSETAMVLISFMLLVDTLGVSVREIVLVLWRPSLAAACMYSVVQLVALPDTLAGRDSLTLLADFLTVVLSGVIAYAAFLYILWMISARPVGAESRVLNGLSSIRQRLH